jgi:hypothetical protein
LSLVGLRYLDAEIQPAQGTMDAHNTNPSLGSPTALNTRANNDLWVQAVEKLSTEDKTNIDFSYKLVTLSTLEA